MIKWRNKHVENEAIVLESHDSIYDNTHFVNCTIQILDPRDILIGCSKFTNTIISLRKKCKGNSWTGCFFDTCTFEGNFFDINFGRDGNLYTNGTIERVVQGGLRNCDFTDTKLDCVTFYNCTPEDLRMPRWPHVTIFNPGQNADDFAILAHDPILEFLHRMMTGSNAIAKAYDFPIFIRDCSESILRMWQRRKDRDKESSLPEPPEPVIDTDKIRALLATKPYVFM